MSTKLIVSNDITKENGENLAENEKDFTTFLDDSSDKLKKFRFQRMTNGNLEMKQLTNEIFDALPSLLKTGVDTLSGFTDKEVFLYGAMGCLSSVMPNVYGTYHGKSTNTNLFIYVLGTAGGGKGALEWARRLVSPIHLHIQSASLEGETEGDEGKTKKRLFIPANTSSAGAMEMLNDNDGKGLIFETEGDTLANVFSSDFGNFSDSFRKAFHHERISFKRVTGGRDIDIERPCLSTVLSSTFGQLERLVPNVENGLFSRFMYYEIQPTDEWINPFSKEKRLYNSTFDELGNEFLKMYQMLKMYESLEVILTPQQEDFFNMTFKHWKQELQAMVSEKEIFRKNELDGTVHRLGLIFFRMTMIFTVIRNYNKDNLNSQMICNDVDFYNAFEIVQISKNNAYAVFTRLPKPKYSHTEMSSGLHDKATQYERVKELYESGESIGNIAMKVFGDKRFRSKAQGWIDKIKEENSKRIGFNKHV